MRAPNYNKRENLEKLAVTIKTVLEYGRIHFKTRNLVRASEIEDGHFFTSHLRHLMKKGYLTAERLGKKKNTVFRYSVHDRDGLHNYYQEILKKLPSEFVQLVLLED